MTSGRVIDYDNDTIDFSIIRFCSSDPLFDIYGKVVGLIYKNTGVPTMVLQYQWTQLKI